MITITLLHPGSMGAAIGAEAVRTGARVLWVPASRSEATRSRAEAAGLEARPRLSDALSASDVVLSVCPTQAAEAVAEQVAQYSYSGTFVEANAISPQRAKRIAAQTLATARFVDGCIFGPDASKRRVARLFLSGGSSQMDQLVSLFQGTRVETKTLEGPIGTASALKMAFINFQRSVRALTALSYALAEEHDLTEELTAEAQTMGSVELADLAALTSMAAKAWRWAPEMHEVAETLHEANLPAGLAQATADVLLRWEGAKDRTGLSLGDVVDGLRSPRSEP